MPKKPFDLKPDGTLDSSEANKPIALKKLIKLSKNDSKNLDLTGIVTFEQHVVQEQEQEQQIAIQEEQQQNVVLEQSMETYTGETVGYHEFINTMSLINESKQSCKEAGVDYTEHLETLKTECFANLPEGIKAFTPEAALVVAKNLPQLVSFNKDNLPQGFILRQTKNNEYVLDYEEYVDNNLYSNEFTPEFVRPEHEKDSKYAPDIQGIGEKATSSLDYKTPKFENKKEESTYFSVLENFTDNPTYTTHKAFDKFWRSVKDLCEKQNVKITDFTTDWSVPACGNPVVYMERLLIILKNARNLGEQFKQLHGIKLDNYGAYYASCYEGFNAVSREMYLNYNPEEQNQRTFDRGYKLYRVSRDIVSETKSETTIESKPELTALWSKYSTIIRYIAQQTEGITSYHFMQLKSLKSYMKTFNSHEEPKHAHMMPLILLYFCCHDRYKKNENISELLESIFRLNYNDENNARGIATLKELERLSKLSINFGVAEGQTFLKQFSAMNSHEFKQSFDFNTKQWHIAKKRNFRQLIEQLIVNKQAIFNLIAMREKNQIDAREPILFPIDTAEFLSKSEKIKKAYNQNELLMLAGLTRAQYYRGKDEKSEVVKQLHAFREQLQEAVSEDIAKSNRQYLLSRIIQNKVCFRLEDFVKALADAKKLIRFDPEQVDKILTNQGYEGSVDAVVLTSIHRASKMLKSALVDFILAIESTESDNKVTPEETLTLSRELLSDEPIENLKKRLKDSMSKKGRIFTFKHKNKFTQCLKNLVNAHLDSSFTVEDQKSENLIILDRIKEIIELQNITDFDKANAAMTMISSLAVAWSDFSSSVNESSHKKKLLELFKKSRFNKIEGTALKTLLKNTLPNLPSSLHVPILETVLDSKRSNEASVLVNCIDKLSDNSFDANKINDFLAIVRSTHNLDQIQQLTTLLIKLNNSDSKDPLFALLNKKPKITSLIRVLENTDTIKASRDKLKNLLLFLDDRNQLESFLDKLSTIKDNSISEEKDSKAIRSNKSKTKESAVSNKDMILSILLRGHQSSNAADYVRLIEQLNDLADASHSAILDVKYQDTKEESKSAQIYQDESLGQSRISNTIIVSDTSRNSLAALYALCQKTSVNCNCLQASLANYKPSEESFRVLLERIEKAPFGKRDLAAQFSTAAVERVINNSKDLLNDKVYSFEYRKKLMEAFLFVNTIGGKGLGVFSGKSAIELTNAEIKKQFQAIKENKPPYNQEGLDEFKKSLFALALMRESMYRTTGEFPYSTQIIAHIDALLQKKHFIANINTGEGKSQMDCMKCALLWLQSDRVDMTTSSIEDARRDIEKYGNFFDLLGIPYSRDPIQAKSDDTEFAERGVNFSTFAQLSLFFSRRILSKNIDRKDEKNIDSEKESVVSLVVNESDHSILDDNVIYRFSIQDPHSISPSEFWIYEAINEWTSKMECYDDTELSAQEDVRKLKQYLLEAAAARGKSNASILRKFPDSQYLIWIKSSLVVNHLLKENKDYMIDDAPAGKVNNDGVRYKIPKVLMNNGKLSQDSQFGQGMHQLLVAKLMADPDSKMEFFIEPESRTIIASSNRNLLEKYLNGKGHVWGSSGTVGSASELDEQYRKYGFAFGKLAPHRKKQVEEHNEEFHRNEQAQFARLVRGIIEQRQTNPKSPQVMFFKDIDTLNRFHQFCKTQSLDNELLQLFTGLGDERPIIDKGKTAKMLTLTTSALGRNTDFRYNKKESGLIVWHTSIDSIRNTQQKSGRTGRQGSKGQVFHVLNQEDLEYKTTEVARQNMDAKGKSSRDRSEPLYIITDHLLNVLLSLKNSEFKISKLDFLKKHWSVLSRQIEERYRKAKDDAKESKSNKPDFTAICKEATEMFNKTLKSELKHDNQFIEVTVSQLKNVIQNKHKDKASEYYVYDQESVLIENCTKPLDIAYHLIGFNESYPHTSGDAVNISISKKLDNIIKSTSDDIAFDKANQAYIEFLNTNHVSKNNAVNELRKFFRQRLLKRSLLSRLFGRTSLLNRFMNNDKSIVFFRMMTTLARNIKPQDRKANNKDIYLQLIKSSIETLLDDYLKTSWFISASRKGWANELKGKINGCDTVENIIKQLSDAQLKTTKHDILRNKSSIKPIHFLGSRYLDTVAKSLELAINLGDINKSSQHLHDNTQTLTSLLYDTTAKESKEQTLEDKTPPIDKTKSTISYDKLLKLKTNLSKSGKVNDPYNSRVIIKSLHRRHR